VTSKTSLEFHPPASDNSITKAIGQYKTSDFHLGLNDSAGTEDSFGVTQNDSGDTDTGPNDLQNFPVITKVEYLGADTYKVYGDLDENSSESLFDVEICESDNHESNHGGCIQSLGTTEATSPWNTTVTIPGSDGTEDRVFTTLATNNTVL